MSDPGRYEGRWRTLPNLARDIVDSIHDDARARELGFRGGFVPGSTVVEALMPAILDRYGKRWFEGGWYDLKFIAPVYVDDEVRELAELAAADGDAEDAPIALSLVTRDGRLACGGRAGLGTEVPWQPQMDGQRGGERAFPHLALGTKAEEREFTVEVGDYSAELAAAGNDSPWFRESSPWGGAIVPPIGLFRQSRRMQALPLGEGVRPPGINADFQIVMERPVFAGETYRVRNRLADKGVSRRCWFRAVEFDVADAAGRRCARGRHNVKWFIAT